MKKIFIILFSFNKLYYKALFFRVGAAVEHHKVFKNLEFNSIIDIGANRGQFSMVARRCNPLAQIFSFDPLDEAEYIFNNIFANDKNVKFYKVAIGNTRGVKKFHISNHDDSSSLLPILKLQNQIFPGTSEARVTSVNVNTLKHFIDFMYISRPSLLKIDVQGFEMEVLKGCASVFSFIDFIYCECSYFQLYKGQELAPKIQTWLSARGFVLVKTFNPTVYKGKTIQQDFLFQRKDLT